MLVSVVHAAFTLLELAILAEVIWSWVDPNPFNAHPARQMLRRVTEPLMAPIRRVVPPLGGMLDLSPLIALVLIQLLDGVVVQLIDPYARF